MAAGLQPAQFDPVQRAHLLPRLSLRRGCFQALCALHEGFVQLLEGPALQPDFLRKRGHGRPKRIKIAAVAAGLLAFQRRKRISVLKRGEQPGGQSLRWLLIGHRPVKPRLEIAYNPFPFFRGKLSGGVIVFHCHLSFLEYRQPRAGADKLSIVVQAIDQGFQACLRIH